MPRDLNPGTLSTGGGLAAQKSVEASSFVHPTQGLDTAIAHIVDPSQAHEAEAIHVVDMGGYFASDEVEGALQEIASSAGAGTQNGVIAGGTFTSLGLTVTLATPTSVRVGGTERDLSGETEVLADNSTSWLYVDASTGALTSTVGAVPSISSPENVLLWQITTLAGAVTTSRDARWFVRNIERKLPCTVRASGTAADRNSEAAFESIDAALLYLSNFATSGVLRNFTLVLKGALTVSSSLVIPVDGVTLQGDGGCTLTTGAALTPMIDVSGRSGIRIRDITFIANHAASTAIGCPSSGLVTNMVIERCSFSSGTSQWGTAVDFNQAGPQNLVLMRGCSVTAASYGVRLREPTFCRVMDTTITETGGAGVVGVHLGQVGGGIGATSVSDLRGVNVVGFATGGFVRGSQMGVDSSDFTNSDTGLQVGPNSADVVVSNSTVEVDATNGLVGLSLDGDNVRAIGCRIRSRRAGGAYAAEVPIGIDVVTGVDGVHIIGCQVESFLNTVTPGGYGIRFAGTSASSLVSGCSISTVDTGVGVVGLTERLRIVDCAVLNARVGMDVRESTDIIGAQISLDLTRGFTGINVTGSHVRIASGRIVNDRGAGTYGGADIPVGIQLNGSAQVSIDSMDISGFYNSVGSTGSCILASVNCIDLTVTGGVFSTAWTAISVGTGQNRTFSGVVIRGFRAGISVAGSQNVVTGCILKASSTFGVAGITTSGTDLTVTGCTITNPRAVYAGETPTGIALSAANAKVTGCLLRGWRNAVGTLGRACAVLTGAQQVTFENNVIEDCWYGIWVDSAAVVNDIGISGCTFQTTDREPVLLANTDRVRVTNNTIVAGGSTNGILISDSVDTEVLGNQVFGSGTLPVGIVISGTDAAGNRARRFTVSGNTVTGFTTDGILLSGYVQNGIVSENTVDGYIAGAPYDPTATACIRLLSLAATSLVKSVVVQGNTCLRAQNGIVVAGVSATVLATGIVIQGNVVHHCAVGSGGTTTCVGVDATWVSGLQVDGNTIYKIGRGINDSDVEGPPAAGPFVWPYGVRVQGGTVVRIAGNQITDPTPNGAGPLAYGITFSNAATVAGFDARDVDVSGNQVTTSDGVTGATYGILVETGGTAAVTTLLGLRISDNEVRRVTLIGILLTVDAEATVSQAVVSGNTVSQCLDATVGRGIYLFVDDNGVLTGGVLREILVSENAIGNTGDSGIYVRVQAGTTLTGLDIRGNSVSDAGDKGIEVIAGDAPTDFSAVYVDDNMVLGSTNEGIHVEVTDFAPALLSISRNTVAGANGAAASGRGVSLVTATNLVDVNDITDLTISGNQVRTNNTEGIYIAVNGAVHNAVISGNLVRINNLQEGLSLVCNPTNPVIAQTYSENLTISGNTFRGGAGANLQFSQGIKIRNLSFVGNTVHTSLFDGFRLGVTDATVGADEAVIGILVADNIFTDTVESGVLLLLGDAITEIDSCANVVVRGNQFVQCNTGAVDTRVVQVRALGTVRDLSIADNSFVNCGAVEDDVTGNIDVRLGVNGPSEAGRNVRVTGNSFESCSGLGVMLHDHAAAGTCSYYNVQVSGNEFYGQTNDPIRLSFGACSAVEGVLISDNTIQAVAAAVTSDGGITVLCPSAGGTVSGPLSILDNVVLTTGNNNVDGAIQVVAPDDLIDLRIEGNTVSEATALTAGIYVTVDGLWTGGSVSNNSVGGATNNGIRLDATGVDAGASGIRGVVVTSNAIRSPGANGIYTSSAVGASTPVLDNLVISGNSVEDAGARGIYVACETMTGVSVLGNTLRNVVTDGIYVDVNDDISGLTVSGNTVTLWSTDAGATVHGGIRLSMGSNAADTSEAVTVSNNTLWNNEPDSTGIYLLVPSVLSGMVVSGNVVHLNGALVTRSLYFDAATGSQVGLSFTGNSFRGAVTGVSYAGAAFAPDYSLCVGNVERTNGGGGNWGNGVGGFTAAPPWTNSTAANNQD